MGLTFAKSVKVGALRFNFQVVASGYQRGYLDFVSASAHVALMLAVAHMDLGIANRFR